MNLFQISRLYAANNEEHARLSEAVLCKVRTSALANILKPYTEKLSEVLNNEKESLNASRQSVHTERIKELYRSQVLYKTVIKKSIQFYAKTGSKKEAEKANKLIGIYNISGLSLNSLKTEEINKSIQKFLKLAEDEEMMQIAEMCGITGKIADLRRMNEEYQSLLKQRQAERKTSKKTNAEPLRKATDSVISLIDAKLQTLRFEEGGETIDEIIEDIQWALRS